MSVLGITNDFDIFFSKIWHIQPIQYGDKQEVQDISKHLMQIFEQRGDEWAHLFNVSCATRQYYSWDGLAPVEYVDIMETMRERLAEVISRVAPEYKYVKMGFIASLQGRETFLPTISVMMGKEVFDTRFGDWPPVTIHIGHKASNYFICQNPRQNPLPTPKYSDYIDIISNPKGLLESQKVAMGWKQFPKNNVVLKWGD